MPASRRSHATPIPLLAALAAALLLVTWPLLGRAALADATSWIDAPLDGSVLPLAPYEVVAHSADQAGIAEILFDVDGTNVDSAIQAGDGSSRLVTSRFRWVPPGFGIYVLTVRARNTAGELGAPASATVVIAADARTPAPTIDPGASPGQSPGPSSSAGTSLPPGQSAIPPTSPPGVTPGPTRTATPTPEPCTVPVATVIYPVEFIKLYPPETNPEFLWEYSGDEDCIESQTLVILVPPSVGEDEEIPLGAGARSYQRRDAFEPDLTDPQQCGHYHWYILTLDAEGTGEQSAPGSFDICANPDG